MCRILIGWLFISSTAMASVVWHPLPNEAYAFGKRYPEAQNLLFAFDYGHALLYEELQIRRGSIIDPEDFEQKMLETIFKILRNPPTVKVDENDIAPAYTHKMPLILSLFDWSHLLHQFVLDVLASSKDRGAKMQKRVEEIYSVYQANSPVAITDQCKTMQFMDGHYFSKAFRRTFPSLNLLIWSYHWFQIRLYEALLHKTQSQRDRAVEEAVNQFWALLSNLPDSAEFDMMPWSAVESPSLARRFPRIPAAFDNNHMLHDIVSDLLVSDRVADADLRKEGARMGRMAMDPNSFKSSTCP